MLKKRGTFKMKLFYLSILCTVPMVANAAITLDSVTATIDGIGGGVVAAIALALEMLFRLIKSKKPLSLMYGLSNIFAKIGSLLKSSGELLDKVLPQRVK